MPALFGPVLTNTPSIAQFLAHYANSRFSAAKVVTGWGVDGGWNAENRALLVRNVPKLVVRSVAGDPSNRGESGCWFPHPDLLVEEFRPWVALRPDIWLEVGNEPDVAWELPWLGQDGDEMTVWRYRYWLDLAERRLRAEFPHARLIGPSPRIGRPGWESWLEVPADVLRRFNSVSVHLYGWHRIIGDGKGELAAAQALYSQRFPDKTVAVTELGINDRDTPHAEKMRLYREFAVKAPRNWTWALAYHYDARRDFHQEYAFLP